MSWGGRGNEDETRESMVEAARRSGMSVSELVQALAEGSPTGAGRDRRPGRGRTETPDADYDRWDRSDARRGRDAPADLDRQLDALAERLRNLSSAPEAVPARSRAKARDRAQDSTLEEIAATVERLSRQIPETVARRPAAPKPQPRPQSQPQPDVTAVLTALDGLDRKVKAISEDRTAPEARPRRDRGALGDLDRAIAEIAQRQTALEREKRPRRAAPVAGPDLDKHFRDLSEKIEQLRNRDERNSPAALLEEIRSLRQFIEQSAGAGVDVGDEIRKLTRRIDQLAALDPERATLEPLMTEMGRLRDVVLQTDVEGSLKSLEAGYGHIVDRLDDLKRGLAGPRVGATVDAEISEIHNLLRAVPQVSQFTSIEQTLRELAGKVERLSAVDSDDDTVRLERRMADLKTQIERIDPSPVVKALDQRLKLITDKLDAIEKASRGPVTADRIAGLVDELRAASAGSRTGEEMRALESRLAEISDRIADLDRRRPSFDDTDRLHERIAEIAGKIDRIAVPVTDRRTVDALEATIARLDEMMSRQHDAPPAGQIDSRFAELFDRLDRGGAVPAGPDVEALGREIAAMRREIGQSRGTGDLEAEMRKLAERLERSTTQEPDDEALNQIEEQLAAISRQLEATESRFAGFSGIEATIRRLGDRLETQQADTLAAARDAAREMVRELGQNRGEPITEGVLRSLQGDLKSLQSAARDTESRTNDTLISLHDALTGIVGRLSAIEKIAQGSARAAAARAPAPETPAAAYVAAPTPAPAPAPAPTAATRVDALMAQSTPYVAAPSPATPGGGVASAIARAREALASTSPEDTRPLEPGSGKPTSRATGSAPAAAKAPSPAPTEPPPAAQSSEGTPAAARKADFIAAARRAAQAAATATEAPLAARAEDRAGVVGDATDANVSALSRIGQVLKSRRRPVVLATAAVVLAFLTLRLIPGGERGTEIAEAPQPEAQQSAESKAPAPTATPERADATAPTAPPIASGQTATAPSAPVVAAPAPMVAQPAEPTHPAVAPVAQPVAAPAAVPGVKGTPTALSDQPSQRTSALSAPTPDASMLGAPATTGSIGAGEAARPAAADSALPAKIGSDALRRAAEAGDPRAAFEVGMRFAEGRGIAADPKAAAEWYAHSAEKGLVPAQYRYAVALEKGIGVTRDTEQAKRWYLAAAERGNVRAMHNLGVLYANGRDINAALPWFQKAADLGLKDSQFNLGIIHALGSGVKQDLAVSYKWFALAARQGDKEAEKKQTDVAGHLDKVNLAAARMAVQTWVQKPLDRDSNEELQVWNEPKEAPKVASATGERDLVLKVQSLLQSRGIYAGPLDGQLSPRTRTAIKTFQKKQGQAQTGEVDARLMQMLAGKTL